MAAILRIARDGAAVARLVVQRTALGVLADVVSLRRVGVVPAKRSLLARQRILLLLLLALASLLAVRLSVIAVWCATMLVRGIIRRVLAGSRAVSAARLLALLLGLLLRLLLLSLCLLLLRLIRLLLLLGWLVGEAVELALGGGGRNLLSKGIDWFLAERSRILCGWLAESRILTRTLGRALGCWRCVNNS